MNALDAFKAQREAVDSLHARLTEVGGLVSKLKAQVDGLALHPELKEILRDEEVWVARAEALVRDVRYWREQEYHRFGLGVVWRWTLACIFAFVAITLGGAGYAWETQPYAAELEKLRTHADVADLIGRRLQEMTPEERLEFNRLMKLTEKPESTNSQDPRRRRQNPKR